MINDGNPYAPVNAVKNVTATEQPKVSIPEEVNTIKETLEWVGTDTDRAILVLEHEETQEKPRTTLIEKLEELING